MDDLCCLCFLLFVFSVAAAPIDRHALVTRHDVVLTNFDVANPLSVGNGEFCFTVDATGTGQASTALKAPCSRRMSASSSIRLAALPPPGRLLRGADWLAALGVFLLVVVSTFPVVVPFLLTNDAALAMRLARAVTVAMLFLAGFLLGRHAGHTRPLVTGLAMGALGALLILAVMALGG